MATEEGTRLDVRGSEGYAELALASVHREYPRLLSHWLRGDEDARPPRELTPAFYGCLDWHSAVHNHWMLARLARLFPGAPYAPRARAALATTLSAENVEGEVAYRVAEGRASFEVPYGLAWLLELALELREWEDEEAKGWLRALGPLETLAADRFRDWLPKLPHPVRTGEHTQTAFSLGLVLDWARCAGDAALAGLVESRARDFYLGDRSGPLGYEPSGNDFLSPCLGEADLMRRVLPPAELARWLAEFLPRIPRDGGPGWLRPVRSPDRADGKLVHLDGLCLSRAWMLEGIASSLPQDDPRIASLRGAAVVHRQAGLEAATSPHYEGSHWLPTFAVYLSSARSCGGDP